LTVLSTRIDGQRRLLVPGAALIVLVLAASAASLRNGFAYDDVAIIRENEVVHGLGKLAYHFVQGYWPQDFGGRLYRPLTLVGFSLQWVAADGAPWLFHLVNVAVYAALTLAVFAVGLELLPFAGAWAAAAVFAVHPVHVEAVGNGVGQAELTTALAVTLGVGLYLRARRKPDLRARESIGLFLLLCIGALFKENGIMLAALLVAAEFTVVVDRRPLRQRVTSLAPTFLLLAIGTALVLGARRWALGATIGEYTSNALYGQDLGGRVLTMLNIVPQWLRLLVWPAHLQVDYGPPEFDAAARFGLDQAFGLALLALVIAVAWLAWRRRRPVITFGIVWTGVALIPVSNVLLATGIALAERTLMLPSVGVALAGGAAVAAALPWLALQRQVLRVVATAMAVAVLACGAVRSSLRQAVWRDTRSVVASWIKDAPMNYLGWSMYGDDLVRRGRKDEAIQAYARSLSLYRKDASVYEGMGRAVRARSGCPRAIPIFARSLEINPGRYTARGPLYVCLLAVGDTTAALAQAAEGAKRGEWFFQLVMTQTRGRT
jgi:protein O-mannosyl-transferase